MANFENLENEKRSSRIPRTQACAKRLTGGGEGDGDPRGRARPRDSPEKKIAPGGEN